MKNFWLAAAVIAASGCVSEIDSNSGVGQSDETLNELETHDPPMLGVHWAKGAQPGGTSSSPDLLIHQGGIMSSPTTVQPIFWGTSWGNASFVGDKISGIESFYSAVGGSHYLATTNEYTDLSGNHVSTSVSRASSIIDTSAAPARAPKTSAILAEVCAKIANPSPNAYYPVYTDAPRGHAGYCAWHSWGTCNGVNVQFGFFFSLDNDSGCDVAASGSRSQGMASLVNVSGHELSEMLTDPRGVGWTDSSGSENSDKCAWVFDQPAQLSDGSTWTIQGNWSNAAYDSNTGFANRSGQNGCLYNK